MSITQQKPGRHDASGRDIAVIGSGIAGMTCAWLLSQRHRVTVFESSERVGGHTNTVEISTASGALPVDTGFIVYNERAYPNLPALFDYLGVATQESEMSFAVSLDDGRLEFAATNLGRLFAQPSNLPRPRFWGMLRDFHRFYRAAPDGSVLNRHSPDDGAPTDRVPGRVELHRRDYRDCEGTFDRVVSIEMPEAVGREYWPAYFATIRERLRPGGIAVLQVITMAEDRHAAYERGADFIQGHILPGGMLPADRVMREQIAAAGLSLDGVRSFGASYARTLADWQTRFQRAWLRVRPMGFDERFKRKWEYYLAYCEAGFLAGALDVGLYRLHRPATGAE